MRPISIQLFPKRTQGARRRMATLPARMTAFALRKTSPHLSWTLGIMGKFVGRRSWPGKYPEAMMLARASRCWTLLFQTLLGQRQSRMQPSAAPTKEISRLGSGELNRRMSASPRVMTSRLAAVEPNRSRIPATSEDAPNRTTRPWLVVPTVRRNLTIEMVGQTVPQRLHPMYRTRPSALFALTPANRVIAPPRFLRRDEVVESGAVVDAWSTLVLRKHRRVEELSPTHLHNLRAQTPVLMPEKPVVIERAQPRVRARQEPALEAAPRERAWQRESVVDVAQITDAVISQLDRRLIAARERRGKI